MVDCERRPQPLSKPPESAGSVTLRQSDSTQRPQRRPDAEALTLRPEKPNRLLQQLARPAIVAPQLNCIQNTYCMLECM
jgi:hypothetical protein